MSSSTVNRAITVAGRRAARQRLPIIVVALTGAATLVTESPGATT
jgi:hypothetical protein